MQMKRTRPYYHREAKNSRKKPKLSRFIYPESDRDATINDIKFGNIVNDPYRWLENPDFDNTKKWINDQNILTMDYINSYPYLNKIKDKLTHVYDYEKFSMPSYNNRKYYFWKKAGLQNHSILYMQTDLNSVADVFFDPNKLSSDGHISVEQNAFSDNGSYWAYSTSENGSDWETIHVKDIKSNSDLKDEIRWVKFSNISWTNDEKGFFYARYPETSTDDVNKNHTIYYHYVGTSQEDDLLIYKDDTNPTNSLHFIVTDCDNYLVIYSINGCSEEHTVLYANINYSLTNLRFRYLIDNAESKWDYITNNDKLFYFMTNHKATNNKIVCINIDNPRENNWKIIVEEMNDLLEDVDCVNNDYLVLTYMKDVKNIIYLYEISTGEFINTITMSEPGTISVNCSKELDNFFYSFTSFLTPRTIYKYSFKDHRSELYNETKINGFNRELYQVQQVFYPNKDGIRIPMYIINKKGFRFNGQSPCYLYGYGGFNVSLTPYFNILSTVLLDNVDMTLVVANLRGGGEYGKKWHEDGMLSKKQNVFDDFQYAAKYLIDNSYTCPAKLTINGASNGGLLVGACINQHPELYGCAIADVGVMDMLRFHKFTSGQFWTTEYGNSDIEEDFGYIYKYSPLHNINKEKPYPAVLLTTADHDDRVVPCHSYKYIAELQNAKGHKSNQANPLMIKVEINTGHGSGKTSYNIINEAVQEYAFIAKSLGLIWHD